MKRYVYKLNFKYAKNPELLLEHGFSLYKPEDEPEVVPQNYNGVFVRFYAINLVLDRDSLPVKRIIKHVNTVYKKATEKEKKEIDDSGMIFVYDPKEKRSLWAPTDKDFEDITKAQLCVCNIGDTRNLLFINAADKTEYYDAEIMRKMVGNIIDKLLEDKVIYQKKTPKLLK